YTYSSSYTYSSYTSLSPGVTANWGTNLSGTPLKTYQASNDPSNSYSSGLSSYLLNTAVFDNDLKINTMTDGASNTILVAEGYGSCYGYTYVAKPYSYNYSGRYSYWAGYYYESTSKSTSHYDWTGSYYIAYYGPTYDYTYSYSYGSPKFSPSGK